MSSEVQTKIKVKESTFNYNLTEMKKALSSTKGIVPRIKNTDDLDEWLNS